MLAAISHWAFRYRAADTGGWLRGRPTHLEFVRTREERPRLDKQIEAVPVMAHLARGTECQDRLRVSTQMMSAGWPDKQQQRGRAQQALRQK